MNRRPHADLDLRSRSLKARKIESLLQLDQRQGRVRLLEVGTGAGGISGYFAHHESGRFDVESVDVHDSRGVKEGYRFTLVSGVDLPFADGDFDVVISNHVIEHVGELDDQRRHLSEMRRVLADGGVGYLAVPNRWMIVEPHYRLAFLSWWPRSWRDVWLRAWGKGERYDCEPLALGELDAILDEAGVEYEHLEKEAVQAIALLEKTSGLAVRVLAHVPDRVFSMLRPLVPTLVCRFRRR